MCVCLCVCVLIAVVFCQLAAMAFFLKVPAAPFPPWMVNLMSEALDTEWSGKVTEVVGEGPWPIFPRLKFK